MGGGARFWRNVAFIAGAHIALVLALVRWSQAAKTAEPQNIVWMDAGSEATNESAAPPPPSVIEEDAAPIASATPESTKSEIELATPTPTLSATAAKPNPTATPKPSPKPSATPTPKATPKKKPKPVVAKTTPAPKKRDDSDDKPVAKLSPAKSAAKAGAKTDSGNEATGKTGGSGSAGHGTASANASEYRWYGSMLHDRFHREWVQPTSVVATGARMSVLVKIRIEADGRVSEFTLVKPSGNVVVDESVAAVSKRVTQVDPLPAGLGSDHYEVKINFELNPEE